MIKYWNNMNILRKKKKTDYNNLFISNKHPNFYIDKKYNYKNENFSEDEIKEISNFYNNNYTVYGNSNINQVNVNDLKRYLNSSCEIVTIKNSSQIIGCMISFYLPMKINISINKNQIKESEIFDSYKSENSIIFACSSFLVLHYKYRGKGLGMSIIQKSLNIGHDKGCIGAYFVNSVSRCSNSIPLFAWNFIYNFEKIDPLNNIYYNYRKSFEIKEDSSLTIEKVGMENLKKSYQFYNSYCENKKFYFSPSYEYWDKWVNTFPTYIVFENNKIIGVFSFENKCVYYTQTRNYLNTGHLIICIGEQPKTLNSALIIGKNIFDYLVMYEIGDLNKNVLSNVNAQQIGKIFINFYNTTINLRSEELYIPIF